MLPDPASRPLPELLDDFHQQVTDGLTPAASLLDALCAGLRPTSYIELRWLLFPLCSTCDLEPQARDAIHDAFDRYST